jgi:hypothetical protein
MAVPTRFDTERVWIATSDTVTVRLQSVVSYETFFESQIAAVRFRFGIRQRHLPSERHSDPYPIQIYEVLITRRLPYHLVFILILLLVINIYPILIGYIFVINLFSVHVSHIIVILLPSSPPTTRSACTHSQVFLLPHSPSGAGQQLPRVLLPPPSARRRDHT